MFTKHAIAKLAKAEATLQLAISGYVVALEETRDDAVREASAAVLAPTLSDASARVREAGRG